MKLWSCDFEEPVELGAHYVAGGQWWRKVEGVTLLPGIDMGFQPMVGPNDNPEDYVREYLVPPGLGDSRCLLQVVIGDAPMPEGPSRSNWFYRPNLNTYGRELRQRWRVYLPSSVLEIMSTTGRPWNYWQVWEYKAGPPNVPPTIRGNLSIVWSAATGLRWVTNIGPSQPPGATPWYTHFGPAVIPGSWFNLDAFVRFSRTSGALETRINGQPFGVYKGPTIDTPASTAAVKWKLATLYTGAYRPESPPWQLVDDIVLTNSERD